jgi:hypothetical protein
VQGLVHEEKPCNRSDLLAKLLHIDASGFAEPMQARNFSATGL